MNADSSNQSGSSAGVFLPDEEWVRQKLADIKDRKTGFALWEGVALGVLGNVFVSYGSRLADIVVCTDTRRSVGLLFLTSTLCFVAAVATYHRLMTSYPLFVKILEGRTLDPSAAKGRDRFTAIRALFAASYSPVVIRAWCLTTMGTLLFLLLAVCDRLIEARAFTTEGEVGLIVGILIVCCMVPFYLLSDCWKWRVHLKRRKER
jgi:hypothetical protein